MPSWRKLARSFAMTPQDIEALYDAHAPRLYALALRITGDADAAAAALESAFLALWGTSDAHEGGELRTLVRLTRERALERKQGQTPVSPVDPRGPTPASLVEELFFGGLSLREIAARYGLDETQARRMILDGMAALRIQVAQQE